MRSAGARASWHIRCNFRAFSDVPVAVTRETMGSEGHRPNCLGKKRSHFVSELEKRNLEVVKLWAETYNNDVDRMVNECYAENCEVSSMFGGAIIEGRPRFLKLEPRVV